MSSARPKSAKLPAMALPARFNAPNPTASAAPALTIEPNDAPTDFDTFLTVSSIVSVELLTFFTVSVKLTSFAENPTVMLLLILEI